MNKPLPQDLQPICDLIFAAAQACRLGDHRRAHEFALLACYRARHCALPEVLAVCQRAVAKLSQVKQ